MSPRTNFTTDWQQLNPDQNVDQKISVTGIYDSKDSTKIAIDKLKTQGFSSDTISLLIPDKMNVDKFDLDLAQTNRAPQGTIIGATSGAVIGGAIGWLIAIGAFSSTGTVPILGAVPVVFAITGLIIGGFVGAISGGLIGLGIPAIKTKIPPNKIGGIFLSVRCSNSDLINRAKKLLEITGAHDISSISEA